MRAALIALALLVAGCGPRGAKTVEIDPALARLIPSDTTALVNVKVDRIRTSPLYRKYGEKQFASFNASEVLFVSNGKDQRVFAKEKAGLFELKKDGTKSKPSGSGSGVPPALRELMRSIPAGSQVWGVGLGASLAALNAIPQQGNLANLRNLFQALESWTLAADVTSGVKAEVNAVYRTEQDARQIHDALRGLVGLARLSTPSESPELLRLYDGIQISMEKSTVRVKADIAADLVDKAVERLPRGQR
ncbi:MAG TPA: hypothetical protein VLH09_07210 [Bryobacteraceae bacterium]|nr:hypothetical protein [Bryobacteraceae bacterium]